MLKTKLIFWFYKVFIRLSQKADKADTIIAILKIRRMKLKDKDMPQTQNWCDRINIWIIFRIPGREYMPLYLNLTKPELARAS